MTFARGFQFSFSGGTARIRIPLVFLILLILTESLLVACTGQAVVFNRTPVATNDSASTDEDTPVTIAILANDSDADGSLDPATITITTQPTNGSATVNTNGTVTYMPAKDYNGPDSFGYMVNDELGTSSNEATVSLTVDSVNDAPRVLAFGSNTATGYAPQAVTFTWTVTDVDGDSLTCELDIEGDGTFDYTITDCQTTSAQNHTFSSAGYYTAVLAVMDGQANQAVTANEITIYTEVGGILAASTSWEAANSPYYATTQVQVPYGATLTLEPGVEVFGDSIKTWGVLNAIGTSSNRIIFDGVDIIPGTSNSGEPYQMTFQYVEFRNVSFLEPTGFANYGSFSLRDSVITSGFDWVYIWYPTSDVFIERNVFYGTPLLSIGHRNAVVYVRNNAFPGGGRIENWAAYNSPTIVQHNSFLDSAFRVALREGYDNAQLDARENYWGTTNAAVIEGMILDKNDSLTYADYIPYEPFLTAPHSSTPSP